MLDEKLKEFCTMHRVNVIDTNKRAHRMTKMNTRYFQFADDYNKVLRDDIVMETEPLWTVEITPSELEKMADFEAQVFNNMRAQGHYNMFEILMEQKEEEKFLRNKYSAVRKAYEHYSLMLKLAQSGEFNKE
jgi:hypothetical protein